MKRKIILMALCLAFVLAGCGTEQTEAPDAGFVQVVNPLVSVESVGEMEEKLGYSVPVLDKDVESYIVLVIDGVCESGRIRYADGSDFNIKEGSGDISGIYGGALEVEENIHGTNVSFYVYEELRYAIWEKDGFTYGLTGGAALPVDVAALLSN